MQRTLITLVVYLFASVHASADDWPEFRGEGRAGVWNESGILEKFPTDGLKILWNDNSWSLIRPSGTEPIIRLFSESDSQTYLDTITESCSKLINNLINDL